MLTKTEAQQITRRFLLAKYYDSKVDFNDNQLIFKDGVQIYQLEGEITMRSRNPISRFTSDKTENEYKFKIEVDVQHRQVINYELR